MPFKFISLIMLLSFTASAQKALVRVLEAPAFRVPDKTTKVIQYFRKGDLIKINGKHFNREKFRMIKNKVTKEQYEKYSARWKMQNKDKLLVETPEDHKKDQEYLLFIDRRGKDAYVLKEHVEILYEDPRELEYQLPDKDPTEYRLDEKLADHYPFYKKGTYSGHFNFSLGTHTDSPYPYKDEIQLNAFDFRKDFHYYWSRQVDADRENRFHFGGVIHLTNYTSEYILTDDRVSTERNFRLGVGPHVSYEPFRFENWSVFYNLSIPINFINSITITQEGDDPETGEKIKDERTYTAINFSPNIGAFVKIGNYKQKNAFTLGTNVFFNPPYSSATTESGRVDEWWQGLNGDAYAHQFNIDVVFTAGFHSSY